MATYTKFQCFVEDICEKKHNLGSDTLKVALSNASNARDGLRCERNSRSSSKRADVVASE